MRIARRTLLTSMIASVAAPAVFRGARASATSVGLKLHHFFSSVSCGHDRFLVPWVRKVEAESAGRIRIDIFPSMQLGGAPAQLFDQARDGFADIVWAMPGSTPGRFARIEAFELPFVASHRALVNSRAIQDYAAGNLQDEFRDVRPLSFSCRDRSVVHSTRPLRGLGDLKDLRLHVPNRFAGDALRALGGQGIAAPMPQVRMAIAGHVIDGALDPWDVMPALKLYDVLKYHAEFTGASLSTSSFVLAMNRASYERLPDDLKTVIDNNSGQVAAGMAGAMWDLEARAVLGLVRDRGDPVAMLAEDDVASARKATEPVIAAWVKLMKDRKADGGKLLAGVRKSIEKYAGEPEPEPPAQPSRQPEAAQPAEPKVATEPTPTRQSQTPSQGQTQGQTQAPAQVQTQAPTPAPAQVQAAPAPAAPPQPATPSKPSFQPPAKAAVTEMPKAAAPVMPKRVAPKALDFPL